MSDLFVLAADFIDRVANPGYGIRVNEDYSLALSTLLGSEDRAVETLLSQQVKSLYNPDALTPHGWLWLMAWARSSSVDLNNRMLLAVVLRWPIVFVQVPAIELATRRKKWRRRKRVSSLASFGHPWLRDLLKVCVEWRDYGHDEGDGTRRAADDQTLAPLHPGLAQSILVALLQLGNELSLDAAATLLNHSWPGQTALLASYEMLLTGLDPETRSVWELRLGKGRRDQNRPTERA